MNSYLLYGPPAGGKTTIAQKIAKKLDIEYVSVGQITREEIAKSTKNGELLKKYLNNDITYPIELISSVVRDKLNKVTKKNRGFILDGFPKYEWEALYFLEHFDIEKLNIKKIMVINVPLSEILKRAEKRRICEKCLKQSEVFNNETRCANCSSNLITRQDDRPDLLKKRYEDYTGSISKTLEILTEKCGKVIYMNGSSGPDEDLRLFIENLI